jgi:hypothetical protein
VGSGRRYAREPPEDLARRHCWVLRTATDRGPWPGLILEWRRTNAGDWAARVIYVPRSGESRSAWFSADLLRPVEPKPQPQPQPQSQA